MQLVAREALPQLVEKSESAKGQGLLQAFLEGTCCSPIDLLQIGVQIGEPSFGGLVGRLLVGPLEPGSPGFLVGLREVADNIFPLVPPAALDLGSLAEDLIDGLAQALAPVDDAKNALLVRAGHQKIPMEILDLGRCIVHPGQSFVKGYRSNSPNQWSRYSSSQPVAMRFRTSRF